MATRRGPDESVRVACSGTFGPTKWTNVFWLHSTHTTPIDSTTMNTLCGNIFDLVKNNYVQSMSEDSTFTTVTATYFPTGSPLVVVGTHTGSQAGGQSGATNCAASIAAVISWQSGVYWRGGKPRTYVGALQDSALADMQNLDSGFIATLLTEADGLITGFNALTSGNFDSIQLGLVSFVSGGVDRVPPVFFPITGSAIHSRIDSQRRRLGKA